MTDFDWLQLLNPEFYISLSLGGVQIGLYVVLFIVFAETGLFAGFFLPGDSLLFLAGIYSDSLVKNLVHINSDFLNVTFLATLVAISGVLGNIVGYWFGFKSGHYLFKKEDTFWYKRKYLFQARDFFTEYGGKAIIFARFFPIIRTFTPIVAGVVGMNKKKFMIYNIISSILWSFGLIFAGHYLYGIFNSYGIDLKEHIEKIIVITILVSTFPVFIKFLKKSKTE